MALTRESGRASVLTRNRAYSPAGYEALGIDCRAA